jgi:hypothetical protein
VPFAYADIWVSAMEAFGQTPEYWRRGVPWLDLQLLLKFRGIRFDEAKKRREK